MPQAPAVGPAKFIWEIDEYLGQTFDQMTQLDERFGKFSAFFLEQAGQVMGDRDFNKLSKDEQNLTAAYAYAALAVEGACAVVKGIKETVELERVKRLHRTIAEKRYDSLAGMIKRAQRCHDEAAEVLMRHKASPYKISELSATFQETADLLETELCQFRALRFRLDMLLWLQDEYDAWMENRLFSDTPIPTTGQATVAAIYLLVSDGRGVIEGTLPPLSRQRREEDLDKFADQLVDSLTVSGNAGSKEVLTAFEILAMIDGQLGAVLEHASLLRDPLSNLRAGKEDLDDYVMVDTDELIGYRMYADLYGDAGNGNLVEQTLSNNPLVSTSIESWEDFEDMVDDYEKGCTRTLYVNSILMAAMALIPIWTLDWAWYWRLVLSVVALGAILYFFTRPSLRRMTRKLLNKFEMMSVNYEYCMAQQAGLIEPKSRVKEMVESRNGFWGGLIGGAILGSVFFPIGTIIGAILGAIIFGGSSDDVDDHGEGWQNIKICSPVKQWITAVILACAVGFEIYALFIS